MRLFTAIDLPDEILKNLERLLRLLKPAARINWSPIDNMHITTKFIGEWPDERLQELEAALGALRGFAPIPVHVRNLGFFPNPHSPRVFWAGVDAAPDLAVLAKETDQALSALGVEREKRVFSPHLTLARIKEPVPLQRLRATIAGLDSLDFGRFVADRFFLYLSKMRPQGSVYTKLAEFPLTK
jgi:2'-5' RNA ligase